MKRHAIRSGDVDDVKGGCQTDRGFRDVDMEEDGEDQLDRTQSECRSIEKGGRKRSSMDIIITRQTNWIGHILRGNSLQREIMEGRMEGTRGRGRPRQKLMDWMMEDSYWKLKEKAQHPEEWCRWTFGPAGRQIT